MQPDYLIHARKDIGLREIKGPSHAARIIQAFSIIGHPWLNTDEHAWCAGILGAWFKEKGLSIPKNAFRALSWAEYGYPVGVMLGAIAVITRKGGGHVGLVTGITKDGKAVRVLGGNQGDMVCESWFPIERITTFRCPLGYTLSSAPIAVLGEISKKES